MALKTTLNYSPNFNSNKRNILNVRLDEVRDSYENKISKVMRD